MYFFSSIFLVIKIFLTKIITTLFLLHNNSPVVLFFFFLLYLMIALYLLLLFISLWTSITIFIKLFLSLQNNILYFPICLSIDTWLPSIFIHRCNDNLDAKAISDNVPDGCLQRYIFMKYSNLKGID